MPRGSGLAPMVYRAGKDGNTGYLTEYAAKHFDLHFVEGTTAEEMVDGLKERVASNRAAAKAEVERLKAIEAPPPVPEPPSAPIPIVTQPVTDLSEDAMAPGVMAETAAPVPEAPPPTPAEPDKPLDPYASRGFVPGASASQAVFYDEKGNPLRPDSHPVLSEAEAFAETSPSQNYRAGDGDPFRQGSFGVEAGQEPTADRPHGPVQNSGRFRHPQNTVFLINPRTGMAFRPTELLMRAAHLTPHFDKNLPAGIHFGA